MYRIIFDTDPGIDDALALLLALASSEVRIEAITTVSGNVHIDKTTRNALILLELVGCTDIPVARGSDKPLVRQPQDASSIHGSNGLGAVELPEPSLRATPQDAVELIIEKVMAAPGEMTLLALGPLTNIALAVHREPLISRCIREVVIMGGALRVPGNVTPEAEFNIYADPHAAHIVFHAGWPIRLVSLDVTRRTRLLLEQVGSLIRDGNPLTELINQMVNYYFDAVPSRRARGFAMHDPLCLAAVFQPELINWEPAYVNIEVASTTALGKTVAYFDNRDTPQPNVQASVGVDSERFIQLYLERMRRFSNRGT